MNAPATFDAAVKRATLREGVLGTIARDQSKMDQGKRPMPETKNLSVDTYSPEYIADEAAGLRHARPPLPTAAGPAPNHEFNDPQFPSFLKQMENEPAGEGDPVEDLVKRFKAWQIYSKAERDPTKLKALVLKMYPPKKEERVPAVATTSTYVPRSPYCAYCKKDGHWVQRLP